MSCRRPSCDEETVTGSPIPTTAWPMPKRYLAHSSSCSQRPDTSHRLRHQDNCSTLSGPLQTATGGLRLTSEAEKQQVESLWLRGHAQDSGQSPGSVLNKIGS